jgi:DNA-binding transcriptional ArsR family regulator
MLTIIMRDAVFAAVADGRRRRILELLGERERSAGELAGAFDVSWPAISRHLRLLREAGLVRERRAGRERWYTLERARLRDVLGGWVAAFDRMWAENLESLKREVEKPS